MSGLFDLIKGVALLAGGNKASRMDEERAASENKYREEDISVKREGMRSTSELAAAQRALTEKLTERQIGSTEKMQEKQINWDERKQKAQQEFEHSENKLVRSQAVALAELRVLAEQAMQERSIQSSELMQRDKLRQDMIIAKMNESLQSQGYSIQRERLTQDYSLGQMGVIINSIALAQKATQGMEGIMTASSRMNPSMAGILNSQEQANLSLIFKAIDPKNVMGLSKFKIDNYVAPVSSQDRAGATELAGKLGVNIPTPTTPSTQLLDNVAPPPATAGELSGMSGIGIHPGDQLGLDKVAEQINSLPEGDRQTAFGEYESLINEPTNVFMGDKTGGPGYRQNMSKYLRKSTGFDITR